MKRGTIRPYQMQWVVMRDVEMYCMYHPICMNGVYSDLYLYVLILVMLIVQTFQIYQTVLDGWTSRHLFVDCPNVLDVWDWWAW